MKAQDLKNSILQLAVQGKLVEQDPSDEPASALLERIREERSKLIKEKKIKAPKGGESVIYRASDGSRYEKRVDTKGRVLSDECIEGEIPFEIPESWEWARLSSLGEIVGGGTPKTGDPSLWAGKDEGIAWLTPADMKFVKSIYVGRGERFISQKGLDGSSAQLMPSNSVLMSSRAPIGYIAISKSPISTNQGFKSLVPQIKEIALWVYWAIQGRIDDIKRRATGTTFKEVSGAEFSQTIVPVPPLPEQRRIAERVSDLMPLVEEYGRLEDEREALDAALPERLRKSVLQMAVEGKLVPQDPSDEPASALLGRIRAERAKLIKDKKVKAPKGGESVIYLGSDGRRYEKRVDAKGRESEPVCIDEEIPFEIPEGWEWARLGSLLSVISDGTHKTPEYTNDGVLFLSAQNISKGFFDLNKVKHISRETHEELCKRVRPQNGDILLCRIGTLGKPIIVDVDYEFSIFVSLGLLRPIDRSLAEWVVNCLNSPMGFNWIQAVKVGGGTHTFKINLGDIPSFLVPIPPFAEQRRIAEQISVLNALVTNR